MKERNKSDWTDEEKVRMNKITKQRMINRRRRRRRDFIDTRNEFIKLGSGQTTRLLLGISVEEWSKYLFNDFKKRYPDPAKPFWRLQDILITTRYTDIFTIIDNQHNFPTQFLIK